jgi:cytochrome oxidase assembly protein ShyY1
VTPLVLANGYRVPIVRGFVGLGPDGDPAPAPVPAGQVTVRGALMVPSLQDRTVRKDLEPLLSTSGTVPALVRAEKTAPREPGAPRDPGDQKATLFVLQAPELSEGPHLSYAVQWFIFSAIALIGYPLILRRVLQRRGKEVDADGDV